MPRKKMRRKKLPIRAVRYSVVDKDGDQYTSFSVNTEDVALNEAKACARKMNVEGDYKPYTIRRVEERWEDVSL